MPVFLCVSVPFILHWFPLYLLHGDAFASVILSLTIQFTTVCV